MNVGRLEQRPVDLEGCLFIINAQSHALVRELFTVHIKRKIAGVLIVIFLRFAVQRNVEIYILKHGEQQTSLSIDSDLGPAANVNVFSSTIVRLERSSLPLFCSVAVLTTNMAGFSLTRLRKNWAL